VQLIDLTEEGHDEGIAGRAVELLGGAGLHDGPVPHQGDAVGHKHRLFRVVGHQQRTGTDLLEHVQRIVANAVAQPGIEAGEWLVQEHQGWCRRQRARQRHPLLLPARQGVRIGVGIVGNAQLLE